MSGEMLFLNNVVQKCHLYAEILGRIINIKLKGNLLDQSLPGCPSFQGSSYIIVPGSIFPSSLFNCQSFMSASLAPCHSCVVGYPSAGDSQLLVSMIVLGPFLWLTVVPYC